MARVDFRWEHFLTRLAFALVLVGGTYNPTGYSYFHWAVAALPAFSPEKALAGVLLVIGWVIFARATVRSLGPIGVGLALALMAALVWLIFSWGLLSPDNPVIVQYVILVVTAVLLAIGMSWSYVRRRLSGQIDVDDVET